MDPNARRSQFSPFNTRQIRTGPLSPTRMNEQLLAPRPTLPGDSKAGRRTPSRAASSPSVDSLKGTRKIATNSKIRDRELRRNQLQLVFVNDALQQKLDGQTDSFDELVEQFTQNNDKEVDSSSLRSWLSALSHVISRLERPHAPLVQAIIDMKWSTMDGAFVKAYTSFIGMLVSARPEYLLLVLTNIAAGFTYQPGLQTNNPSSAEGSTRPLTRRIVYERLHYMLSHLLDLIPTLASSLQPLLIRNFPHKRQSQVAQVTFIRNLLRITDYCPELFEQILSTVIDRAIQIDVEIQVELEELEALEEAQGEEEIFDVDPFDTVVGEDSADFESDTEGDGKDSLSDISSDAGGGNEDEASPGPDIPPDAAHIHDMVGKLDAILKLIFDHFDRVATSPRPSLPQTSTPSTPLSESPSPLRRSPATLPSAENSDTTKSIQRAQFYTLLGIFDRTIIKTFKSRYTQFLLYWFASRDAEYSDLFQGMLVSRALYEDAQPIVTRAAATSYTASLISRATFIDRDGVRKVTALLCNALRDHLDAHDELLREGVAPPPGAQQHGLFYAIAQAVFLVFCFRWRDLLETSDEDGEAEDEHDGSTDSRKWMSELLVISRVVNSTLNPLKMCSQNVVMQFARVAHHVGFAYCYTILEANKRSEVRLSSAGKGKMGDSLHAALNTFFPFDPFNLPRSCSYVHPVYRDWSSVAIEDSDDEEEEDDDEDDDQVDDNEHEDQSQNGVDETGELGASFGGMSISPERPTIVPSIEAVTII